MYPDKLECLSFSDTHTHTYIYIYIYIEREREEIIDYCYNQLFLLTYIHITIHAPTKEQFEAEQTQNNELILAPIYLKENRSIKRFL